MANTIKLKTSAIQGKSPLVSDLQISEFAWNSFDGKLYGKKNDGTASIVEIGGGSGVSDYNDLTNKPDLSVYALQTTVDGIDTRVDALEDNAFVTREVPAGSINGTNAIFTLANTPVGGSEQVFLNGVLQESGASNDYTISGATITFNTAPETGWKLHVSYATGSYSVAPGGGGAFTPFRWTTTEQVYPLEVSDDNATLYAKIVNMGTILASGELEKPLVDIEASLTAEKVYRIEAYARVAGRMMPISFGYRVPQYNISWQIYNGKIAVEAGDGTWNSLGCQAIIKIIYKK